MATVHDVAIIPAPTADRVVLRVATSDSSRTTQILAASVEHSIHCRFSAETSDVWLLFGELGEEPTVDQAAVAGATRPSVHIPAGESVDFLVDKRNSACSDISDDVNGIFSIVQVSK